MYVQYMIVGQSTYACRVKNKASIKYRAFLGRHVGTDGRGMGAGEGVPVYENEMRSCTCTYV